MMKPSESASQMHMGQQNEGTPGQRPFNQTFNHTDMTAEKAYPGRAHTLDEADIGNG